MYNWEGPNIKVKIIVSYSLFVLNLFFQKPQGGQASIEDTSLELRKTCGLVVVAPTNVEDMPYKVLLLKRIASKAQGNSPFGTVYDFPKGKMDPSDKSEAAAALRELEEETGLKETDVEVQNVRFVAHRFPLDKETKKGTLVMTINAANEITFVHSIQERVFPVSRQTDKRRREAPNLRRTRWSSMAAMERTLEAVIEKQADGEVFDETQRFSRWFAKEINHIWWVLWRAKQRKWQLLKKVSRRSG